MKLRLLIFLLLFIASNQGLMANDLIELGREAQSKSVESTIGEYQARLNKAAKTGFNGSRGGSVSDRVKQLATKPQYPITTKLTLSGSSTVYSPANYLGKPMCLIGSDQLSKQWLANNLSKLIQYRIPCILIEARSEADLQAVRKVGRSLPIFALPMDDPLSESGVKTYPILVVSNRHPIVSGQ